MKNMNIFYKSIAQRNARDLAQQAQDSGEITLGTGSRTARERLDNGSITARVWKYAAMLLMVLTLGVGEMWG